MPDGTRTKALLPRLSLPFTGLLATPALGRRQEPERGIPQPGPFARRTAEEIGRQIDDDMRAAREVAGLRREASRLQAKSRDLEAQFNAFLDGAIDSYDGEPPPARRTT